MIVCLINHIRGQNTCVFVKNTIFKSKIYSRSEPELKANFKDYFAEAERAGVINDDIIRQKRMSRQQQFIENI